MSALAERPSTASSSQSMMLVIGDVSDAAVLAEELAEEPIDFGLSGVLLSIPQEPEVDEPPGAGPFGV